MINKKYLVAAILAAAVSSNAFAEEKKNEISAFVYASKQTDPAQDAVVTVYASYGKYIKEQIAITGSVSVTKSGGTDMGGVGVGGKYYFRVGQKGEFVPFVLAEVQFGTGSGSGFTLYYGNIAAGGGASYFITETASIDGRAVFQAGTQSVTTSTAFGDYTSSNSTSAFLLTLGLTQRF